MNYKEVALKLNCKSCPHDRLAFQMVADLYNQGRVFHRADIGDIFDSLNNIPNTNKVSAEEVLAIAKVICATARIICPIIEDR